MHSTATIPLMFSFAGLVGSISLAAATASVSAGWPQFRGPNGSGIASDDRAAPTDFGANQGLLWQTELSSGHSSPCIWGDRIFLTGFTAETKKLETICLDRTNGKILWRQPTPDVAIEKPVHKFSSPAASTPATDGERVYVYFGSYGILAYDFAGKEVWTRPLPTPPTHYGTASSPIVSGDLVLLQRDGNSTNSQLLALEAKTGQTRWTAERPLSGESFSTPMIWKNGGKEEVIAVGNARLAAYDLRDGKERWWAPGISFQPIGVAVAGEGLLFASSSGVAGESEPPYIGTWEEILGKFDANKDGQLAKDEVPENATFIWRKDVPKEVRGNTIPYRWFLFDFFEGGKDGIFTATDWKEVEEFTAKNQNTLMAIRPGGSGNVASTHTPWKAGRGIPDMPSPLYYRGRVYLVMDGGRLTTYEAKTGKIVLDRERLGASEQFASSPVAAGGNIYVASVTGKVVVIKAADTLEVLAINDLAESIVATPAIVAGRLYVRTAGHLYAFGH